MCSLGRPWIHSIGPIFLPVAGIMALIPPAEQLHLDVRRASLRVDACGPFDRTSGRREVTTLLASWVRDQILDDGSYPMGIRFPSKHGAVGQGNGYCWAFWLRRVDIGLTDDPVTTDAGTQIHEHDPAYTYALERHGIRSR